MKRGNLIRSMTDHGRFVLKVLALTLSLFCWTRPAEAQRARLDSLLALLQAHPAQDAGRVRLMNQAVRAYYWIDPAKGEALGNEAITLARKIGDPSLLGTALTKTVGARQCTGIFGDRSAALEEAIGLLTQNGPPTELAYALWCKSIDLPSATEPDTTYPLEHRAWEIFKTQKDAIGEAWCLQWAATIAPDRAMSDSLFARALELCAKAHEPSECGFVRYRRGMLAGQRDDYPSAVADYLAAVDLFHTDGATPQEASVRDALSTVFIDAGDYPAALEQCIIARQLNDSLGNRLGVCDNENTLAELYKELGDLQQASEHVRLSYRLAVSLDLPDQLLGSLDELGLIQIEQDSFSQSLATFKGVRARIPELRLLGEGYVIWHTIECERNMGLAYMRSGDETRAKESFERALRAADNGPFPEHRVRTRNWYANALLLAKRPDVDQALVFFHQAADSARTIGLLGERRDALLGLSLAYGLSGNDAQALRYLKAYIALKDTLQGAGKQRALSDLRIRYETEREEQKIAMLDKDMKLQAIEIERHRATRNGFIAGFGLVCLLAIALFLLYRNTRRTSALLTAKNEELVRAQDELMRSERQREAEQVRTRIARDIHDEIGGELTKIAILTRQAKRAFTMEPTSMLHTIDRIGELSKSVGDSLGDVVWSADPQNDSSTSLVDHARDITQKMLSSAGLQAELHFDHRGPDRPIAPSVRRDIFLVLKEALNNALKYAHASRIVVTLNTSTDHFELRVVDDGVGFQLADATGGNGLRNMKVRAERIGARFAIMAGKPRGTIVEMEGPTG